MVEMETANKKFRYSIRKFKVGVGSVLIATCLLGAGVSTPTAFAMADPSPATEDTEVKNTPLQHLKELVEELKTDLAELEKLERYEKSAYPTQDYLWTDFSRVGIKEMERVSSLKEDDPGFLTILQKLYDFRNHITWERLTRQVDQYRKKYPNNKEIEEKYEQYLEQTPEKTYAAQEELNLQASTKEAEQALEQIKEIVEKLEPKAEEPAPVPEAPTPKEDAPKAEEEAPKIEEKAPESKEETPKTDTEAPKDEKEVPAPTPIPDTPKEEEGPKPMEPEADKPTPPAPDAEPTPEAPKAEEDTPAPKVEEETQEPKTEEKTPETKEETPTPKDEEIPAPIPDAPAPKEEDTPAPKVEEETQEPKT
ncbi:TPA: YSIRK-type signal peptide-containing protein, partial [Streptococcus suis]|nr:YSIRK-type signal peptide-containing protein [Streptococcus suis]